MKVQEMKHLWLLSFGDSRYQKARQRFLKQAQKMRVFGSRIRIYDEHELDESFVNRMAHHLNAETRGFGYWCWKPQIVLQLLLQIPENDVILYLDMGCHLNPKGIARLQDYYQLALEHNVVAFQSRSLSTDADDLAQHFLPEREWTKHDVYDSFNCFEENVLRSGQIGATAFLVKRTDFAMQLMRDWRQVYFDNFALCDDTQSLKANHFGFKENRHDQSVFSLICKKNRVYTLSAGEYTPIRAFMPKGGKCRDWPDNWYDLKDKPIWAKHDKDGRRFRLVCPDWVRRLIPYEIRKFVLDVMGGMKRCSTDARATSIIWFACLPLSVGQSSYHDEWRRSLCDIDLKGNQLYQILDERSRSLVRRILCRKKHDRYIFTLPEILRFLCSESTSISYWFPQKSTMLRSVFAYRAGCSFLPFNPQLTGRDIIDGGPASGDSSLVLAEYAPHKVYAFEPSPLQRQEMSEVLELNSAKEIIDIVPFALAQESGAQIRFSDQHNRVFEARTLSIDEFSDDKDIGLIKLDIEGAERQTLKGAKRTIARCRPILLVCVYHRPDDLFKIPVELVTDFPDYEFVLRDTEPCNKGAGVHLMMIAWPKNHVFNS